MFETSWSLLSPAEQRVCRCLSIFQGGIQRNAARQVAGASLNYLSSLTDKSLLRRTDSHRFEMHALIQHYAAEKLAHNPVEQRAAAQADFSILGRSAKALWFFFEEQGRFQEGAALLADTLLLLGQPGDDSHAEGLLRVQSQLTLWLGMFLVRLGQFKEARTLLEVSDQHFRRLKLEEARGYTALSLAGLAWMEGQFDEAETDIQTALDRFLTADDRWGIGATNFQWGEIARQQGQNQKAKEKYLASLTEAKRGGSSRGLGLTLLRLGQIAAAEGHHTEAEPYVQDSLTLAQANGDQWVLARSYNQLGIIALERQHLQPARRYFFDALRVATQANLRSTILDILVGVSQLDMIDDAPHTAVTTLSGVFDHDSAVPETRLRAQALLTQLQGALSEPAFEAAQWRGRAKTVEILIAENLRALSDAPGE